MKRFGAVCVLAFAAILFAAGCNDYGNTFQANTGVALVSISPSIVNAGSGAFTLTFFSSPGTPFVTGTVAQWNGHNLTTNLVMDANSNILFVTAAVPANLIANPGTAVVNTIQPHSGAGMNGLSNTLTLIINPPPNPLPVLTSIAPTSATPGSPAFQLTLTGTSFIPSTDPTGGSTVNWNANGSQTTLATSNVTATSIQATVPASLLATQTCAIVSVYNPPAQATPAPSGVSNPFSGGGGTSANTPGFPVTTDPNFVCPPTTPGISRHTASLALAEETPALGADGRYVAYTATQNGHAQIFVRDTCTGADVGCSTHTALVSAAADGTPGNGDSNTPSISNDGRFVAFSSAATNLLSNTPSGRQVFLRDTCAGVSGSCTPQTTLVSSDDTGALAGNDNLLPSVSSSGRFVAFLSVTSSKYSGSSSSGTANSGYRQIFVRDTCFGAASSCKPATTRITLMPGDTNSLQGKPAGPALSSSAQAVGVSSAATPTLFTRSLAIDDRVFLALTAQNTQK